MLNSQTPKSSNRKRIITVIGRLIAIICVFFVIKAIIDLGVTQPLIASIKTNLLILIILSVLWAIMVFLNSWGWNLILNFIENRKYNWFLLNDIYIRSNIAKYLPGNVMHFVGRNLLAKKFKISQANITVSTITEIIVTILATLIYIILFGKNEFIRLIPKNTLPLVTAVIVILFLILLLLIFLKRSLFLNYFRKILFPWDRKKTMQLASIMGLYLISFLIIGMTFYIALQKLTNQGFTNNLFSTIAVFLFSWLIGFVMPGSSGGLGVREVILVNLLNTSYQEQLILTVIVFHRIVTIFGDILAFLLVIVIGKIYKAKTDEINLISEELLE